VQRWPKDRTTRLRFRRCRRLRYASQSEAPPWRAQRRAQNIRRRLGARGNSLDAPFPAKPPRMRWTTYGRLRSLDAALQDRWLVGMMAVVGKLEAFVACIWAQKKRGRQRDGDPTSNGR